MKPTLQALVLADQIYVDGMTGKKVIAGTFNRLWSARFPDKFGRSTFAYVSVTNVTGKHGIALRFVDLLDNSVIMQGEVQEIDFPQDRLRTNELIIAVPQFPMPHAGMYAFEVYIDDESIGSLRVQVSELREPNA